VAVFLALLLRLACASCAAAPSAAFSKTWRLAALDVFGSFFSQRMIAFDQRWCSVATAPLLARSASRA